MASKQARRALRHLPAAEASWTVDPLSDLVSATELAIWRRDRTTEKILRFLARRRMQVLEYLGDGKTTAPTCEATALLTTEAVTLSQTLQDLLTLEAKDIADFYGLEEPADKAKEK